MRRMTGTREQVLAAICFFSVQVRIDAAVTDTEGCVEEGDGRVFKVEKLTHTAYAESYLTPSFLAPTGALGDRISMFLRA